MLVQREISFIIFSKISRLPKSLFFFNGERKDEAYILYWKLRDLRDFVYGNREEANESRTFRSNLTLSKRMLSFRDFLVESFWVSGGI